MVTNSLQDCDAKEVTCTLRIEQSYSEIFRKNVRFSSFSSVHTTVFKMCLSKIRFQNLPCSNLPAKNVPFLSVTFFAVFKMYWNRVNAVLISISKIDSGIEYSNFCCK